MPTFATLCYLWRGNRVLLIHKAHGLFGEGKWNAPGGKLQADELPETAALREMHEETRLRVGDLKFHGLLNFYIGRKRELDQTVFIFSSKKASGRMRNGREGELRWFADDKIPYDEMWVDDRVWVPLLVAGKRFVGNFEFTEGYKKLLHHRITLAE